MASFTGTSASETITPALVSPGVTAVGGTLPSDLADIIDGAGGDDTIDAGGGADSVRGGTGNDTVQLGAGDDTVLWDVGDGSDTIDGGADLDTLVATGSGGGDSIAIASPTAAVATVTFGGSLVTTQSVEQISLRPLGGADNIVVNDLGGTAVTLVAVDLAGRSALPDGAVDNLTIDGPAGADSIALTLSGAGLLVSDGGGPMPQVLVSNFDALDTVQIGGGAGADVINALALGTAGPTLVLEGGPGIDQIFGSGRGDRIIGGVGDDTALMGAGNDTFAWAPGDGNDIVEGQAGIDTLEFNGNNVSETFDIAANGGRIRMTRNIGSITMDLDGVEVIRVAAGDGFNTLIVGGLSGTDVGLVAYTGGVAVDMINAGSAVTDIDATGGDGNDQFTAGSGSDILDGGVGSDALTGGAGNDLLIGAAGADVMRGGAGDDVFRYLAGSDVAAGEDVAGQAGIGDTLQLVNTGAIDFIGIAIGGIEVLQFLSGNSSATFAATQLSDFSSLVGGAGQDSLTVTGANVDLSNLAVSSWSATDSIVLLGTAGADDLTGTDAGDTFLGGAGADTLKGRLGDDFYLLDANTPVIVDTGGTDTIVSTVTRSLAGFPTIENLTLAAGNIDGTGNDLANTIIGSSGNNRLFGGAGNDTLDAGAGNDFLDGGPGLDTLRGGLGNDTYVLGNDPNTVVDTGGTADLATTTATRSMLTSGLATVERLMLLSGNINGTGNKLDNTIVGSAGANTIKGGLGNDALSGGRGNDRLYGEAGKDTLTGGAGRDIYAFTTALNKTSNVDRIVDFSHRDDTIQLGHSFFKGMGTGGLKPKFFQAGTHADDVDDHIIYNSATGALYYDSDGTGAHAQVLFAIVSNHARAGLAANDFVLI